MNAIIPDLEKKNIPYVSLSNVIRIALLFKYGGVWVDSTVYCNQPLDSWLNKSLGNGFFAFSKPGPDRMLSSWFLAATKNHYIVEKWYEKTVEYWTSRSERHTYHWFHYLFGDLYLDDLKIKKLWDEAVVISADEPHYFIPYDEKFSKKLTKIIKDKIDHPTTPVFKLTNKFEESLITPKSVLPYLLSNQKKEYYTLRSKIVRLFSVN